MRLTVWATLGLVFLPIGWVLSSWKRVAALLLVALVAVRVLYPSVLPDARTLSRVAGDVWTWLERIAREHDQRRRPPGTTPPPEAPAAPTAPPLRVATFNLHGYGGLPEPGRSATDEAQLAAAIRALDADVIAVQEVRDTTRLERLAATRLRFNGRDYRLFASMCGGRGNQYLGFLYDAGRLAWLDRIEQPSPFRVSGIECEPAERPFLVGIFNHAGQRIELVNIHLAAFADWNRVELRMRQIDALVAFIGARQRAGVHAIAALGDFNSTGYYTDAYGERTYLLRGLGSVGLMLLDDARCSAYWKPRGELAYIPSLLDHIAVSEAFPTARTAAVRGYCERLACAPAGFAPPPPEYDTKSA